jgi:hypothetical protein
LPQTPYFCSQVSTERIFTACTLAASTASMSGSSMSLPASTITSPVAGSLISSTVVRPRMREPSEATT